MIKTIELLNMSKIDDYIEKCNNALSEEDPIEFKYPLELANDIVNWEKYIGKIKNDNEEILKGLRNKANIYAIYTMSNNENWKIKYIGQRKAVNMRDRITHHLITKHNNTGAKLKLIQNAVENNEKVGLRFLFLPRDTMRAFIEEELIIKNKTELAWNIHA